VEPLLAHLLDAARGAPSAHNTQPWRVGWWPDRVEILVPPDRMLSAADPKGHDLLHAVGALVENLHLTLAQQGYEGHDETAERIEEGSPVVTLRWQATTAATPDPTLYRMIPIRRTSRLRYRPELVPAGALDALRAAARPCTLLVIDDPGRIGELRRLVVAATAIQLADAEFSRELYRWLRFSPRDPRWYRDGLNAACLGWKGWEAAMARWLLAPRVLGVLSRLGLHRALSADVEAQAPRAPVLCLLAMTGDGAPARVEAGRCLQRTWLTAAAHGLVTHPLSAAVDVDATRPRALELFGMGAHQRHVNLFRLGTSAPAALSPRLPADEILERGA
jgi:hypothetical protein